MGDDTSPLDTVCGERAEIGRVGAKFASSSEKGPLSAGDVGEGTLEAAVCKVVSGGRPVQVVRAETMRRPGEGDVGRRT